jgi:hypothetical protein
LNSNRKGRMFGIVGFAWCYRDLCYSFVIHVLRLPNQTDHSIHKTCFSLFLIYSSYFLLMATHNCMIKDSNFQLLRSTNFFSLYSEVEVEKAEWVKKKSRKQEKLEIEYTFKLNFFSKKNRMIQETIENENEEWKLAKQYLNFLLEDIKIGPIRQHWTKLTTHQLANCSA